MVGRKSTGTGDQKLIRLQHASEVNQLIKDDSNVTGASESSIIEGFILDNYLSSEEEMKDCVLFSITRDDAVKEMCESVFAYYSAMPKHANKESVIPLLKYCFRMSFRMPLLISKGITCLTHFRSQLNTIYEFFDDCYKRNIVTATSNGFSKVDEEIVTFFGMLLRDVDAVLNSDDEKIWWSSGEIGTLITYCISYFEFENQSGCTLGNWSFLYRLLHDVAEMSPWEETAKNRYEIVKLIKNITFTENVQNVFDPNLVSLTKYVFLEGKALITTEDAEIIRANPSIIKDDEYSCARRIIHGPNGNDTKHPFIILYNENDNLDELLPNLLANYRDEFPNANDAYAVQILHQGKYYDPRIQWYTI